MKNKVVGSKPAPLGSKVLFLEPRGSGSTGSKVLVLHETTTGVAFGATFLEPGAWLQATFLNNKKSKV